MKVQLELALVELPVAVHTRDQEPAELELVGQVQLAQAPAEHIKVQAPVARELAVEHIKAPALVELPDLRAGQVLAEREPVVAMAPVDQELL